MLRFRVCHTAALMVVFLSALAVAAPNPASPAAPAPASTSDAIREQCFEHHGLRTLITIRMRATSESNVSGVFEMSGTQEEDAEIKAFPFAGTGQPDKAAQLVRYRITFAGDRRPDSLRKHRQILWRLRQRPQGDSLIINLYGQRLGAKPASYMFYDVELLPCGQATRH